MGGPWQLLFPMQTDGPGAYDIGNVRQVGAVLYGLHNIDGWAEGHLGAVGTRISGILWGCRRVGRGAS
ncbi:hypothetical protein M405DRAFT_197391 [Rhizopogon salebrosus TDB-379]|nr:hypothetical protein M405DRAFT_197391 [Rhizopogon salebrosus TDB-379]